MKYAVVNTKGGVGKSTTAVHLAAHLAKQGACLLIDGDAQGSAASWMGWRRAMEPSKIGPSPTLARLVGREVYDEGKLLAQRYENTVIDAGGQDNPSIRNGLLMADVAVIPVGASSFDASAMSDMMQLLQMVGDINRGLQVRVLLTRLDSRTKDGAEMRKFLTDNMGVQVLEAEVGERVGFRRTTGRGVTVEEDGTDDKAIHEMALFYRELLQQVTV